MQRCSLVNATLAELIQLAGAPEKLAPLLTAGLKRILLRDLLESTKFSNVDNRLQAFAVFLLAHLGQNKYESVRGAMGLPSTTNLPHVASVLLSKVAPFRLQLVSCCKCPPSLDLSSTPQSLSRASYCTMEGFALCFYFECVLGAGPSTSLARPSFLPSLHSR